MAEQATLARPYAQAVFGLAKDSSTLDEWSGNLSLLEQVVTSAELAAIRNNPKTDKATLQKLLLEICGEHLSGHGQSLLKMLSDNGRLGILPELARQYEELKAGYQGRVKVHLVSTYAVKASQKSQIIEALKKRLGKEIEIEVSIDRTLLGGWLIRTGNQVIDLSARGRLQQLAVDLRH